MATGNLSIKITNGSNYFVSDDEFLATDANFHYGFVQTAPRVTLASVRSGWANFRVGQLVLENRPLDSNHPFGSSRYTTMLANPSTTYAFALNLGVMGYDWITGTLVLEQVTEQNLTFSLYPTEYTVSPVSTVTDHGSSTVTAPWTYGNVTHFDSMVRIADENSNETWFNPTGLSSGVTIYEDGTSRTIANIDSNSIEVSNYSANAGQVSISVSGTKSLEDLMDYVANSLSLDVTTAETTKAPNASSKNIKIRQSEPEPLTEIAGKVCEATNHQFYIAPDTDNSNNLTLFLIDRANTPSEHADSPLDEDKIIIASYSIGMPLGGVSASYQYIRVENSKLIRYTESVRSENKPVGREIRVSAFADLASDRATINTLLTVIRDIDKKAEASVTYPDIQTGWNLGDRFKFGREIDFLNADLLIRAITYDFQARTTTISGDATLSAYVRRF